MRKHRLILLVVNLIAAAMIAGSAFLQWFNGAFPSTIEAHQIASFVPISINYSRATVATNFSISIALFVAAAIFILAGLFAKKLFSLIAAILSGGILALWFIADGLNLGLFTNLSNLTNSSLFGPGVFAAVGAVVFGLLAVLVPKRRIRPTTR